MQPSSSPSDTIPPHTTPSRAWPAWLVPSTEIITVGLPFCAFKGLTGFVLVQSRHGALLGLLLIALGVVDLVVNVVNLCALAWRGRMATGVCLTDVVARRLDRGRLFADLGSAVDVFLSFALVALVIALGWLARLPPWAVWGWNIAVVFNVLGAGIGRLASALSPRRTLAHELPPDA